ncbi:MAG TPA: hypothetical protein VKE69_09510 [Planctomycetota bacterium]|nr:hypothetical protein [Planctomycetota bacterium]
MDDVLRKRVQKQGWLLQVYGGVFGAIALVSIVIGIAGDHEFAARWSAHSLTLGSALVRFQFSGSDRASLVDVLFGALPAIAGFLMIDAGARLRALRGFRKAAIACVLAVVPLTSPSLLLGVPLAAWILLTIGDADVRAALAANDGEARPS